MVNHRTVLAAATLAATIALGGGASAAQDATPVATPESAARSFALEGDQVFPEGVAYQEETGDFFVGSTTDGAIFTGNTESDATEVLVPGTPGSAALGMKVDDQGRLYVAGGPTGLVSVYDTAGGALIAQFGNGLAPNTLLNDLVVTEAGDVYVTDSFNPLLFRIPAAAIAGAAATPGADPAVPVAGGPLEVALDYTGTPFEYAEGFNANGIVATPDGATLLVVQVNTGDLYRIDVAAQQIIPVNLGGEALTGGDGMLLDGQTLYVVREGAITVVDLADDFPTGTIRETFGDPSLSSPTTIARYDGCLLVVNSQFANQGGTPQLPFTVSGIAIPASVLAEAATPEAGTPAAGFAAGGC